MKFLNLFYIPTLLLLFLGIGVETVYAQLPDRSCLTCQPPPNDNQNRFRLGTVSFTDASGNPIDLNNCPDRDNVYITVLYSATTGQNRTGVFVVSTLEITTNTGDNAGITRNANFDFSLGDLPLTGGQFSPVTVKVDLPLDFDCQNESARLTNIRAHWSNPGNSNRCGEANYPPGQCVNLGTETRVITVDGFFYSYSSFQNCFEEDNRSILTYFLTNVAGGNGDFMITWTIIENGVPQPPVEGGLFVSVVGNPNDNIEVSVNVRDSNGLTMNPQPVPIILAIPQPFEATVTALPNVEEVDPFPNGSISISDLDPSKSFEFQWFDELGNIIDAGDPANLTGLPEGTYSLIMTDLDTGVVRCFSRTIDFRTLPVIFENLALDYNSSLRSVNFSWTTTKEWESSHFEVERAISGIQFEKIGEVMAAGWSDQMTKYEFDDKTLPLPGGSILYRLKQMDFTGNYYYSNVFSQRVPSAEFTSGVWRAYPNPTNGDQLRINLLDRKQYDGESITFRFIHPTAYSQTIEVGNETEMNDVLSQLIGRIPKGVFLVEIRWGQKIEHIKILKK